MGHREDFLETYRSSVLAEISLPDCLSAQYTILSCLKEGRRSVYLARDQAGWSAVIKVQPLSGRIPCAGNMSCCAP